MNNFGLGLILNLTDNATSGIRSATGAFNELNSVTAGFSSANNAQEAFTQIAMGARILGDDLYAVGNRITSFFTGVISKINETGTTILSARSQLGTLYGDESLGFSKLEEIKDYAAHSIFNFEDLIPSVIMLKANGIEAFDQIATSAYRASDGVEGYSQTLMDYASDLAAFNPQMMNMYGTGVQAAIGALNEYIAEGNAMSLKRGASLDITEILGEEKGETIEERSRQVADLIEQLGMVGMTANLANTPMQRLSNLGDLVFNTMTKIADYGVFDKYSEIVSRVSDYLMDTIKEEEWTNLAKVIGEALSELLDLLNPIVDIIIKVVDKVRELIATNPELVKTIIKYTAFAGVLALVSGIALKLMSSLGFLRMSISALFKGVNLSKAGSLISLLKNFAKYLAPVTAGLILFKEAWSRDFMGMQEGMFGGIKKAWDSIKLIFDAFTDNTLTAEGFQKAKDLGILPLIEAILQLKYHWGFFKEGFKKGLDAFFETLTNILDKLGIIDKTKTVIGGLGDLLTLIMEKMTQPGMTDVWEKIGYLVGKFGGWILLIIAALPTLINLVSFLIPIIKGIVTLLTAGQGIGLIVAAVAVAVYLIIKYWDEIKAFFIESWGYVVDFYTSLWESFVTWFNDTLESIKTFWINVWETVKTWFFDTVESIKTFWIEVWESIKTWFFDTVESIKTFWIDVWNSICEWWTNLWDSVFTAVSEWWTNLVNSVVEWFNSVLQSIKDFFTGILDYIKSIPERIKNWFFNEIIDPIVKGFTERVNTMWSKVTEFKQNITNTFQSIGEFINNIFSGVGQFFDNIFGGIGEKLSQLKSFASGITDSPVGHFFSNAVSGVKNMIGLATGGYVKTEGVAMLHPNEVVVNDKLTQGLGEFLNDYRVGRNMSPVTQISDGNKYTTNEHISNDNSVVFESGSVVFNIDRDTDISDEGLNQMAEKLMKIMDRKLKLRKLQTR